MATKTSWIQRTAEYRKIACLEIDARPAGESAAKAIDRISAKYNGRALPGGKHLHLSRANLKRIWTRWNNCRSDAALRVMPSNAQRKPIPRWAQHLFESYAMQNGLSLSQLFELMKKSDPALPWTKSGFYRNFSKTTRQRIAQAVRLRRRRNALEKERSALAEGAAR